MCTWIQAYSCLRLYTSCANIGALMHLNQSLRDVQIERITINCGDWEVKNAKQIHWPLLSPYKLQHSRQSTFTLPFLLAPCQYTFLLITQFCCWTLTLPLTAQTATDNWHTQKARRCASCHIPYFLVDRSNKLDTLLLLAIFTYNYNIFEWG